MPKAFRKLLLLRNLLSQQKPEPDEIIEEKWTANFSRPKYSRFDIKSESHYDANLRKNIFSSGYSFVLALKKTACIVWTEAPEQRYRDMVISGEIRIDSKGGYSAGGVFFRMVDNETYYSFLISSRGYFRLEAVRNGLPFPLVGWTELPDSRGAAPGPDKITGFSIIAFGSHIIILINGLWAAEINDSSILEGTICFAGASYESGDPAYRIIRENDGVNYTTEIFLDSLTIDSQITEVAAIFEEWRNSSVIDSGARLSLAETFTAMGQYNAAMTQLLKAWETPGYQKTQRELLLAGRVAQFLSLMEDAESYIGQCYQADLESPEGKEALVEMAKILNAGERFEELKNFCTEAIEVKSGEPLLWNFKGHAHWNLKEYKKAAEAYDKAFELDSENGILAKNAANIYEVMGNKKNALAKYLEAGRVFLNSGNYNDLGLLVPKFISIGGNNWEGRSLAGKWAFAVEDWKMAEEEFAQAEKLRKAKRPKPPKDGAQVFLEALLLIRAGKRRDALPLLEEAVALEKDYALFHFRLAENLFLLEDDPDDPHMLREMDTALALNQKEIQSEKTNDSKEAENLSGWINNFAAQVALRKGNLDIAAKHLEKAGSVLGDLPAVKINRGVMSYLRGSMAEALETLLGDKQDDPEGIMANCAGNLLVRDGRFEEADDKYSQALKIQPDNIEYLCNRASCLIKTGFFGEADKLLAKAHQIAPGPALLEMISFVAAKQGEYQRAEQACRSALEMDPNHTPSLLSLGWTLLSMGRKEEVSDVIARLDKMVLKDDILKSKEDLRSRLGELLYTTVNCTACKNGWTILKDNPPAPALRFYAMPPDNLPAGSCLGCGKTYCIGCAKSNVDSAGRFICPACNQSLKLINDGLKMIVYNWALKEGLIKTETKPKKQRKNQPGNEDN